MQPDIMAEIKVTSSDIDAPASVTAAENVEPKAGKGEEVLEQKNDEVINQSEVQGEDKTESKTKDERKAEGKRIERKLDNLYKSRADAQARATRAEAELASLRAQMEEYQKKQSEIDLDELSFDERISHITDQKIQNQQIQEYQNRLEQEVRQAKAFEWQDKIEKVASVHQDYYQTVQEASEFFDALPQMLQDAVIDSENGAFIAYEFAKNPELAIRIAQANPLTAAQLLLKLEASIEARYGNVGNNSQSSAPVVQPSVSATPKVTATPTLSNTGNAPVQNYWELPMADFIARKNQLRGRR